MSGIREVTEQSMIEAHKAGMLYWKRNKPYDATDSSLKSLANSCGWHDGDMYAFVAGVYGAQRREQAQASAMQHIGVHYTRRGSRISFGKWG